MRTLRKQFPVNWLTSASLDFKIQCVRGRRNQYMKEAAVSVDGLSSLDATYFMILWTGARMKEFKSIFRHFGFSLQVTWNQKKNMRVKFNDANCKLYTNLSFIEVNVISTDQTTNEKSQVSRVHQTVLTFRNILSSSVFLWRDSNKADAAVLKKTKTANKQIYRPQIQPSFLNPHY